MPDELIGRLLAEKVRTVVRMLDEVIDAAIEEDLPVPNLSRDFRWQLETWADRLELPEGTRQ